MNRSAKIWAGVGVALAALVGWLWWRARKSAPALDANGNPLDGVSITGAKISVANTEAIQQIQIFEFQLPVATARYRKNQTTANNLTLHFGEWYSPMPKQPDGFTDLDRGVSEWPAFWKMRVVTVGDASAHGVITPPDFAQS
jgi:hypothetical protein